MSKKLHYYLIMALFSTTPVFAGTAKQPEKKPTKPLKKPKCACPAEDEPNTDKLSTDKPLSDTTKEAKTDEPKKTTKKSTKKIKKAKSKPKTDAKPKSTEPVSAEKPQSSVTTPENVTTPTQDTTTMQDSSTKKVTINNSIEKTMLGYKHWTGRYYPTKFVLSFNGKVVENGTTCTLDIDSAKPLLVRYEYEFLNGRRQGWRNIEFKVNPEATTLNITFNWLSDHHVFIDKANVIKSYAENV